LGTLGSLSVAAGLARPVWLHHLAPLAMAHQDEFSVAAKDLDAAGKSLHFVVRSAWMRDALDGTDIATVGPDGELDVRVSRSGADVVVHGTLKANLIVACARCLEPARITVSERISALVVPATDLRESSGAGEDDDMVPDQTDMIVYDGETVVLDDLVRDELLLGIPIVPLCSEECAGIRRPGAAETKQARSESIDPRLQPLLRLKKT
jgi:uncharacterized protein